MYETGDSLFIDLAPVFVFLVCLGFIGLRAAASGKTQIEDRERECVPTFC